MTSSIDHGTLCALESLLEEFFAPETSAERRRDIEQRLSDFGSQHQSWKQCLGFTAISNNPHVLMFCLNVVESVVARRWVGLEPEERAEARIALQDLALGSVCRPGRPSFLAAKVAKALVGVARHDWPHFYPDFLTNVVQLIRSDGERCILGLVLLRTASEELVGDSSNGREEVLGSGRREELRRLMLSHLPDIISLLTDLLESSATALLTTELKGRPNHQKQLLRMADLFPDMEGATVTATPPPSPTVPSGDDSADECSRACKGTVAQATHILEALSHLLSWAPPLPQCLRPELLKPLFCLVRHHTAGRGVGALGSLAMGTINEVLYRQCLPCDGHPFIAEIVERVILLLQESQFQFCHTPLSAALSDLEDKFPDRLIETVRLLVAHHLSRLEGLDKNEMTIINEFLPVLHTLTFSQLPVERYLSCLDIWADLAERKNEGSRGYLQLYEYYFVTVVEQILCRIRYKYEWKELADIDRDSVDDDGKTQWDYFLSRCIEVIAHVGELFPDNILSQVAKAWSQCAETYLHGNTMISNSNVSSKERDLRRDLASLTLVVGRTASFGALSRPPHAHSSQLESRALELVSQLVTLASRGVQMNPVPSADVIEVHAQNLAALQAWCHWMAQRMGPSGELAGAELVTRSAECAANGILAGAEWSAGRGGVGKAARVPHAAAHLFCTLTAVARPPRLWQNPNVSPLFSRGRDVLMALPEETGHLVARGLQNALLLGQTGEGSTPEGTWNEREALYGSLLSSLVDQESLDVLGNVPSQCSDYARVGVAVRAWRLLADQLENGREKGGRPKRVLHACLVPHLNLTLRLLPHLSAHPGACEAALGLFQAALSVLTPRLLGTSFSSSLLDALLGPDSLRAALEATSTPHGSALVVRFLQLLQLVVVEPWHTFERFVPTAVSLCTDHIHPLLEQHPSPDVSAALLDVLSDALSHQWHRFFVPRTVRDAGNSVVNGEDMESVPEGRAHFLAIMRVFGHALLGEDIALFGRALAALLRLHDKWGLFQKTLFRREVMPPLVSALLWVGVASRGPPSLLHADDLASVLGALHSSDPCNFHSSFLPSFLSDLRLGLSAAQVASLANDFNSVVGQQVDQNTFARALARLGEDLRCHQLCNAVAPGRGIHL